MYICFKASNDFTFKKNTRDDKKMNKQFYC